MISARASEPTRAQTGGLSAPRMVAGLALALTFCTAPMVLAQIPDPQRFGDFFAPDARPPVLALDLWVPDDDVLPPETPDIGTAEGQDFPDDPVFALPATSAGIASVATPPDANASGGAAVIPDGWLRHEHFGIAFALPANFTLLDLEDDGRWGLSAAYQSQDGSDGEGAIVTVAFQPQSEVDAMLRQFDQVLGVEFDLSPQLRTLGQLSLTDRRGRAIVPAGTGAPEGPAELRLLVGTGPTSWGQVPVIGLLGFNLDPDTADLIGVGLVTSLGAAGDPALIGAPRLQTALQGLVRYRMPPGGAGSGSETQLSISFRAPGEVQDHARIIFTLEAPHDLVGDMVLRGFNGPAEVRVGMFSDQPVWMLHGRPVHGFGMVDTRPGDSWRKTTYVMQSCLPGRGPLVIDIITTSDRIAEGFTPQALLAGFELVVPADAGPCAATVMATLDAAATDPSMAFDPDGPGPSPATVPATTLTPAPPVAGAGPPPPAPDVKPMVNPDTMAWTDAQAAGSAGAVLTYLEQWPRGLYANEARDWLESRAIMVPRPAADDDSTAWRDAVRIGNAGGIIGYLLQWPDGAHVTEAQDWLTRRAIQIPMRD